MGGGGGYLVLQGPHKTQGAMIFVNFFIFLDMICFGGFNGRALFYDSSFADFLRFGIAW